MLSELKAYSAMVREKRNEFGMTCAELCSRSRVSTKTLDIIENEKWPASGELSKPQKRGQARCMSLLAAVLGFDPIEWREKLSLPNVAIHGLPGLYLSIDDLKFMTTLVELSGPLPANVLYDLVRQRRINAKSATS